MFLMAAISLAVVNGTCYVTEDLKRPCRQQELIRLRRQFCGIAYFDYGIPQPDIASYLGRDHGTVCHHLNVYVALQRRQEVGI